MAEIRLRARRPRHGRHQQERDENTMRKDFTPSEAVAIGRMIEEQLAATSRQRKSEAMKRVRAKQRGELVEEQRDSRQSCRPAVEQTAEAVGLGETRYLLARKVIEAAEAEPEKFACATGPPSSAPSPAKSPNSSSSSPGGTRLFSPMAGHRKPAPVRAGFLGSPPSKPPASATSKSRSGASGRRTPRATSRSSSRRRCRRRTGVFEPRFLALF